MDYNFESTSLNGNNELRVIFEKMNKKSKYEFTIDFPEDKFSSNDCTATCNNKKYLVEHKNRNFTNTFLVCLYDGKLLLEKHKYDCLIEKKELGNYDDVLYISTLTDGTTYIFKLSKVELIPDTSYAPNASCANNGKRTKLVYYLDITTALKLK
jgi:hypothetical protein